MRTPSITFHTATQNRTATGTQERTQDIICWAHKEIGNIYTQLDNGQETALKMLLVNALGDVVKELTV